MTNTNAMTIWYVSRNIKSKCSGSDCIVKQWKHTRPYLCQEVNNLEKKRPTASTIDRDTEQDGLNKILHYK